VEDAALEIAEALKYPVLALGLAALAVAIVQVAELAVELVRRRRRSTEVVATSDRARLLLAGGQSGQAGQLLATAASSASMRAVLALMIEQHGKPGGVERVAKAIADFDLRSLRRLERSRILVRAGPALGLMGTLIPLSPALSALGEGDLAELSDALRVAFGITVIGILVGMLAFTVALVRERLYAQDHSDLEYAAAALNPEEGG
jgi:biopolymer transport protein ExbB/TolQ